MSGPVTLPCMPRNKNTGGDKSPGKKPSGGKNKTPRTSVQMPTDWLLVARTRAGNYRQPTLWYLISLIEKDAREAGVTDLPALPWERSDTEADDE